MDDEADIEQKIIELLPKILQTKPEFKVEIIAPNEL
jgi:hypothetical protein